MSGPVKKYIVVSDGFHILFEEFADSPEEAVEKSNFDFDDIETFFVLEVTKTWEIKNSPRIVEEDNGLVFLGWNIPQKPFTPRKR